VLGDAVGVRSSGLLQLLVVAFGRSADIGLLTL
jgi:hypothetical protein